MGLFYVKKNNNFYCLTLNGILYIGWRVAIKPVAQADGTSR
jgi:hypothetical protein